MLRADPWRGPAYNANGMPTFKSYSFYDLFYSQQQLIEGQKPGIDPALFKDRIVVVGVSAEGLHEVFTTPFPVRRDQRAEVHANLIDAMLADRSIARAPAWVGRGPRRRRRGNRRRRRDGSSTRGSPAPWRWRWLPGYSGSRSPSFGRGVWIPITVPALAIVFAFVGDLAWKYFVEGRDKRLIKKMFSRYVSKDVFDQLVANPSLAALGGARRNMTVLFSDIRGFTTMSEKGTPEDVVAQLNELFTRMVAVVFDHRGTVDKFVGDMVMALYGAPLDDEDHADHAVQTALAMIRTLQEMNGAMAGPGQADAGHRHRRQHRGYGGRQHWVRYDHELHRNRGCREPRCPVRVSQQGLRDADHHQRVHAGEAQGAV